MARLWLVAALLCVLSADALRIAGPQLVQRNVLTLRGGASPAASAGLTQSWLRVLRRIVFPGNPPRARAPPAEAAPSPAAAASKPAARTAPRTGKRTRSKAGGAVGSVHSVHSKAEFDQLLASTPQKQLVVVDFAASWCGPCQQIAPKFAAMAADMPHVRFVKVAAARTHQPLASHAHVARARTRAAAPVWLHTLCLLVCVCVVAGGRGRVQGPAVAVRRQCDAHLQDAQEGQGGAHPLHPAAPRCTRSAAAPRALSATALIPPHLLAAQVDSMQGADENALRQKVEALAGKPDRWASAGGGRAL